MVLLSPWNWQKFTRLILSIVGRDAEKYIYIVATVYLEVSLAEFRKKIIYIYIYRHSNTTSRTLYY